MPQTPITVSQLAEQIWRSITGGTPQSQPKINEVALAVEQQAAYWGKREMYEKAKEEGQWHTDAGYITPIYGLALSAHPNESFTKIATLPIRPLDLPKDRGIFKVTYFRTDEKGRNHEVELGKLSPYARLKPGGFYRQFKDYYYTWIGDKILVNAKCNDDKVWISAINVYPVTIDPNTNMDKGLKAIVFSEVTKQFRGYSPKDYAADQNPSI